MISAATGSSQPESAAPSWTVRPARPEDVTALVGLFANAYGKTITPEHWRWKLMGLPSPVDTAWLALDGTIPVFQYGGMPVQYQLPEGPDLVMVSVDAMTAPAYRRRGLLTTVVPQVFAAWQAAGIPFTLGLPNERWGSRRAAIGWRTLFPLQWLRFPLHLEGLVARRTGANALAGLHAASTLWRRFWRGRAALDPTVQVKEVHQAGAEFDRLWARSAGRVCISAQRDSGWVRWRYLSAPMTHYAVLLASRGDEPVGYSVIRYGVDRRASPLPPVGGPGYIVELFVTPDDVAARDTLMVHTIQALAAAGFDQAATLAVPGTELDAAWQRLGFRPAWGAFEVCYVPLAADLPAGLIGNPANWHICGGDFDVL